MTPEQVRLVKDSFRKVLPIAGIAADLFYDRLFEIAPDVRPLFRDDLVAQKKKLMAMLSTVVTNLHQVDKIAPAVGDLGKRHVGYGVSAKHFEPVGAALLWTLGEILGADFAPSVKVAWTEAYVALASIMSGVVAKDTRTLRTAEAELDSLRARLAAFEGPPSMPFSA
jgi:hemoglobin-like flavoprotein